MQATIRIKGYDRIEQVALGRRAVLFRARDREHNRPVVFKLLLPHLVEDPRFLKRFKRDVRIAADIRHDNLVNVLMYGRADDSFFVSYEHYLGKRLDTVLSACPRVPVDIALTIITGLARGLDACQSARLIHRDVRPANVVLTTKGGVKLDNLTLATDVGGDFAGRVSTTRAYMSPEQTRGENLSSQSDIYSLGVVAWELLCGKSAFGDGRRESVVERVQTMSLPRVSEINPLVEPSFGDIVARALEKERTHRYASAADLVCDLEEAMRTHGRRPDEKAIARFVEDPEAYTEWHNRRTMERVLERAPLGREASPIALVRHFEKVVYLDPTNSEARSELTRVKRMVARAEKDGASPELACVDPTTTYRVVLESIDGLRETNESFAVKLATKLRVPLPAVRGYVDNMPSTLPGEHPHRKAVFLAGLLEEVGGIARIEVCRSERDSINACPECGSAVKPDADFCPFCQHRFVSYVELRPGLDDDMELPDGPRAPRSPSSLLTALQRLPRRTVVLAALLVVFLIVLLVTSGQ
jgi:serine/threonine protein kinase